MNRQQRVGTWALALGLVFAAAPGIQAKDEVPYKDRVEAVFEPVGMDMDGNLILAFETIGQATQLGRFTSAGEIYVAEDLTFTGVNTLTAANGDLIFLDIISGSLTPTADAGIFVIELKTEFTDGTGRFENVTGGFSGVGELDMAAQTFAGDGIGTISPPGKNK